MYKAWNIPRILEMQVYLKPRTLAHPLNPGRAFVLCLHIPPFPLDMWSLFGSQWLNYAIKLAKSSAKIRCQAQKACCWQYPSSGSQVPS